jgi:glutathione S-transferase
MSRFAAPERLPDMRLYDYAPSANCLKVRILLGLLDRPYERVPTDIFGGDTLTDAFGALNPLRETPVLELDDGTAIAQSNAILWLLADGTPYLPSGAVARAHVLQWLFVEQELIMGGIGGARFRLITGRPGGDERVLRARAGLRTLEEHLDGRAWVVGDEPTIADVSLYAYAQLAPDAGIDLAEHPAVAAWLERVRALPRFHDDLEPYPPNAWPGAGRSVYD